jgi:hypothetical protein
VRAPVVGRFTKIMALAAVAPVILLSALMVAFGIWDALQGRPSHLGDLLGGVAIISVFYTLPILGAVWLGTSAGRSKEKRLSRRKRGMPRLPPAIRPLALRAILDPGDIPLPLFERPLAQLWSKVAVTESSAVKLEIFEVVHGDLLGERGRHARLSGLTIVSCAAVRVDADLPLVVVRPAGSKPFTLPDGIKRRTTELGRFNKAFHLFSIEPYAATALVDPRTIEAIHDFDRRFSVEIGGSWVLVHAPRLSSADMQRLIDEAAGLARVFPRIAGSLYPRSDIA